MVSEEGCMTELRPPLITLPEIVKGEEGKLLLSGLHHHQAGDRLRGLQLFKASLTHMPYSRRARVGGSGRSLKDLEGATTAATTVKENGCLLGPQK